jgi:hypothetical protein
LYRLVFPPVQMMAFVLVGATNRYKCPLTEARRGLIQSTQYKCELVAPTGTNVRPAHLYRAKTPPGTNVGTFVWVKRKPGTNIIPSILRWPLVLNHPLILHHPLLPYLSHFSSFFLLPLSFLFLSTNHHSISTQGRDKAGGVGRARLGGCGHGWLGSFMCCVNLCAVNLVL